MFLFYFYEYSCISNPLFQQYTLLILKNRKKKSLPFIDVRSVDLLKEMEKTKLFLVCTFSALHIACGNQFINSVKILLESGLKDTEDTSGSLASSLAVKQPIIDLIESYR